MFKIDETRLWFELDKIAVAESGVGRNMAKAEAAEAMMRHLEKPSVQLCRQYLAEDGEQDGY